MLPLQKQIYTLEEYLELDHESEEKIEFWDGQAFTRSGESASLIRLRAVFTSRRLTVNWNYRNFTKESSFLKFMIVLI